MLRRWIGSLLLIGSLSAASAQQTYATRTTEVRVGVVILDANRTPGNVIANDAPFVWLNADRNSRIKPAGWDFRNPNAPSRVSDDIAARWTTLSPGNPPIAGRPITKINAAYWEVQLSGVNEAQMAEYDALLVPVYRGLQLNTAERERLRRFVDQGGVLWVDVNNATIVDIVNNMPLPFRVNNGGNQGARSTDFFHPLLSVPYSIPLGAVDALSDNLQSTVNFVTFGDPAMATISQLQAPLPNTSLGLQSIAANNNGSIISVGRIGDGYVVVTGRGFARVANATRTTSGVNPNVGYFAATPPTDRLGDISARFIVNLVSLRNASEQPNGGTRRQNSVPIDAGAPLLKRFDSAPEPISGTGLVARGNVSPVAYKGLLVVATDNKVVVYDANPRTDQDGDGNPDDGIVDLQTGSSYDKLWESANLTGPISSPATAQVPNPATGVPQDQILVTDGNGRLVILNAFPTDAQGRILASTNVAPAATINAPGANTATGVRSPAPVVHEDIVVVGGLTSAQNAGRLWIYDPRTGQVVNSAGGDFTIAGGQIPQFDLNPTVGYIPIADNSGGVDRVIYLAGIPNNTPSYPTAGITSLWIGAKGESPGPGNVSTNGTVLTVETRASRATPPLPIYLPPVGGNPPAQGSGLGVKLTVIDPSTGDPWTAAQMQAVFDGSITQTSDGRLNFGLSSPLPTDVNGNLAVSIRIDYTIDWGQVSSAGLVDAIVRGTINLPDELPNPPRRFLGNLAISPRGTVYGVLSTGDNSNLARAGGTFYAIREENGRGSFRVITRYDLYGPHTLNSSAGSTSVPATVGDTDPLVTLPGATILAGDFARLTFTSGPAVRNGIVYVVAVGNKSGSIPTPFIPFTVLLAFQAEPDNPVIRVGDFPQGSSIVQADVTASAGTNKSNPNRFIARPFNDFVYDSTAGTITLNNLANNQRGLVQSTLSLSQPVIVKSPNTSDRMLYPESNGGRWSPLLWFHVWHGTRTEVAPVVTGETVYLAGSSSLPPILLRGFPSNPLQLQEFALGTALDADVAPDDPFVVSLTTRPWLRQVIRVRPNGGDIDPNPMVRWPQIVGTTSFDSFRQRLLQSIIGPTPASNKSTKAAGLIAAGGSVIAVAKSRNNGFDPTADDNVAFFSGFGRADFVVADQGRLARFDPAGNPVWAIDSNSATGPVADTGNSSLTTPLVRPVRAYPVGDNDTLVSDAGANRVVRLDPLGRELRSIRGFRLDPSFRPDGLAANAPTTLKEPSDAVVFGAYVPAAFVQARSLAVPGGVYSNEYWVRYVIADTGNRRLIEVTDRYTVGPDGRTIGDPVTVNGVAQVGILTWHTPSQYSGRNWGYTTITRVVRNPLANTNYYYVAAIGNTLATNTSAGLDTPTLTNPRESAEGNGSILFIDPATGTVEVISQVQVPSMPQNVFWSDATNSFSSAAIPEMINNRAKRLGSLTSVTARNEGNQTAIMFTDSTGVYEIVPVTPDGSGNRWRVRWMLPNEAYRVMRGIYNLYDTTRPAPFNVPGTPSSRNAFDLRAMYARRLDSGEVLVVNGYNGTTRGDFQAGGQFLNRLPFSGEVVQVDGSFDTAVDPANPNANPGFSFLKTNLGFGTFSIRFELPPITNARPLIQPVFADRR